MYVRCLLVLVLLALLGGCANPVAPSGGPPDTTPPSVVQTNPQQEAVNVTAQEWTLTFSEFVDQNAFRQALSLTPAFDQPLEPRWNGRSVTIPFPEPLRENTTYVLTLDATLRDSRGVALSTPITRAFSTGPTINEGTLQGQVVDAQRGRGIGGMDVYAYARPDSTLLSTWPESPDYRTQTDASGRFRFSYLNAEPYFVVALEDANRNRKPDASERLAVPPRPFIRATAPSQPDTSATSSQADSLAQPVPEALLPWVATRLDTTGPVLRQTRVLSTRRIAVRFDEPITLSAPDGTGWSVQQGTSSVALEGVYIEPNDPRSAVLTFTQPVPTGLRLTSVQVTDSLGTPARLDSTVELPTTEVPDTLQLRFVSFQPEQPTDPVALLPMERAQVRFNRYLTDVEASDRLVIEDTSGQTLPFSLTPIDGRSFDVQPERSGPFVISIASGDSTRRQVFAPMPDDQLGQRTGTVVSAHPGPLRVELTAPGTAEQRGYRRQVTADSSGTYRFDRLPAQAVFLRAFVDVNENGRWDGGRARAYRPAEPITWVADSLNVRPRWEYVLEDTLRIPPR